MKKEDFYNLIKAVPKAELHLHGEAVISRETIKKLYLINYGKTMSDSEMQSLFDYMDLTGFLDCFIKVQNYYKRIEDMNLLFEDFSGYLRDNNIVYCESFFSPTSHIVKGFSFHAMISYLSRGIKKIQAEDGRTVRMLIDVSRSFGKDNALRNLNYVIEEKNPYIIGIGLGGNEDIGPARDFKEVFDKARDNNLHVVAHAGECTPSKSIKEALDYLKAERIGHGISAIQDPDLIQELIEKEIPLEICPTSNIYTNKFVSYMEQHPVKAFYDQGVKIIINTDDPTFFKVSLLDEFWNIYSSLNFKLEEIKEIIKNGFRYAFISAEEKENYIKSVDKAWDDWFKNHPDLAE